MVQTLTGIRLFGAYRRQGRGSRLIQTGVSMINFKIVDINTNMGFGVKQVDGGPRMRSM